jgi:two-component system, cell cycle sensor histidine kinase and response regulator CckA
MSAATATTLVVDDEDTVRHLVRRMLEPEVCEVVEAHDGETALRLIQSRAAPIDVVLTDLVMPGIDGYDLVHVLADHRPDLPVVCMSAFARPADREQLGVPFVPKPFTLEALRATLEPLLIRGRELRQQSQEQRAVAVNLVEAAIELQRRRPEGFWRG